MNTFCDYLFDVSLGLEVVAGWGIAALCVILGGIYGQSSEYKWPKVLMAAFFVGFLAWELQGGRFGFVRAATPYATAVLIGALNARKMRRFLPKEEA